MSNIFQSHNLLELPTQQQLQVLIQYGALLVKSGLLPYTINTPEKAIVIILKGRELGIPPMLALSQIVIINGKPAMQSELMLSLVYSKMPQAQIDFLRNDEKGCIIEASRSEKHKKTEIKFLFEDAERAGLFEKSRDKGKGPGPWLTYPTAMFRARAISSMCRTLFPDIILGISYTPEELEQNFEKSPPVFQESLPPKIEQSKIINNENSQDENQKNKPFIYNETEHKRSIFDKIQFLSKDMNTLRKIIKSRHNKEFSKISELSVIELEDLLEQLKGGNND